MKLSTKGRYAMVALADIALQPEGTLVTLGEVSRRQNISLPYLEQLFVKLRRADLVTSVRGPGGGYRLARPMSEIRVSEIMAAVEAECVPAFSDFVGVEWADSTLDFWWITPTEETWTQANDRIVQCVIYKPDPEDSTGQTQLEVTGSLKDAAV